MQTSISLLFLIQLAQILTASVDKKVKACICDLQFVINISWFSVEPMGRECDQMQIIAIAEYLGVGIDIEYLDGRPFESTLSVVHCGPEDMAKSWCSISLLYRPGHYDILYK